MVHAPDGSTTEARDLLDSDSLALFVLEWLYQSLSLVRSHQSTKIHGIVGLSHSSPFQAVVTFDISPTHNTMRKLNMTAIVVPNVTYLFIQFNITLNGSIDLAYNWQILTSVIQEKLISSWELKFSLKSCVKVGGPDLQGLPSQLKLNLAGYSQGRSVCQLPHNVTFHHAMVITDEILQKF